MAAFEKEVLLAQPQQIAKTESLHVDSDTLVSNEKTVWYLAYGSNMNTDVLTKRRGVKPIESLPCLCESLMLSFELRSGFAFIEPAFATVMMSPDPKKPLTLDVVNYHRVRTGNPPIKVVGPTSPELLKKHLPPTLHGVIHLISQQDLERIRLTEGGGGYDEFGYRGHQVEVTTYDGRKIQAVTLLANTHTLFPNCQASSRYLNILYNGAKQFGVEEGYCDYLKSLQPYRVPSFRHRIGQFIMLVAVLPIAIFFGLIIFGSRYVGYSKRLPWIFYFCFEYINMGIFCAHDYLIAPLFGSGYTTWKELVVTNS